MSYLSRIASACAQMTFSEGESSYYARHILLPGVGFFGQQKLKAARVLVVGAGGLGCPVLEALVGAGVGHLTIVDGDRVGMGNLARQCLFDIEDVGVSKTLVAKEALVSRNPFIEIESIDQMLDEANAEALIAVHDLVVDATDNIEARYLIDESCARLNRPWVHGALYRGSGQVSVFWQCCGARYANVYPERSDAPNCAGAGVLGATASMIGNLQALEVIKLIAGSGVPSIGALRIFDTLKLEWSTLKLPNIRIPEAIADAGDASIGGTLIEPDALKQRLSIGERFRITDLRSPTAYAEGHLPEAENCSFESLLSEIPILEESSSWLLYCEEGSLSALIADAFHSRGLKKVYNLEGGYRGWSGSY